MADVEHSVDVLEESRLAIDTDTSGGSVVAAVRLWLDASEDLSDISKCRDSANRDREDRGESDTHVDVLEVFLQVMQVCDIMDS